MIPGLEHIPADMTVAVEAGLILSALQAELRKGGQWLPIDPPMPDQVTLGEIISENLNGPRRFGYGTIRDFVIGMSARLADGRTIKMGGAVVKNVAGYDLQKMFIGARGSLGSVTKVIFKLRPLPETEQFVQAHCESFQHAEALIDAILKSPITPIVLDLHSAEAKTLILVLGFDGMKEEVNWQLAEARQLGIATPSSLEYDQAFRHAPTPAFHKMSVLPSRLIETLEKIKPVRFVARAGNGIVYYHGAPPPVESNLPIHLWQRAKQAFDPKNELAPLPS